MPPLVPSYVWEQDEHQIVLTISFRGVKAEDIDIYGMFYLCIAISKILCSCLQIFSAHSFYPFLRSSQVARTFLKVSFGKYLLALDLLHRLMTKVSKQVQK